MERNFPIKPTEGKGSKSAEQKKGNEPACQKGTTEGVVSQGETEIKEEPKKSKK